jgi:protein-tyrosine phosphatase
MADPGGDPFDLVVICTANRFRSPVAEAFLRRAAEGRPVSVRSVGLRALEPLPALGGALAGAAELGVDIGSHRSRPLRGESLSAADLVLGFEGIHVAEAVVEAGASRERTFTILEFSHLLNLAEPSHLPDPLDRARDVVSRAHQARLSAAPLDPSFEFADPILGPESAYPAVVRKIQKLAERIINGLFGPAP